MNSTITNCTSWYWSRQSEVYILVETHLDQQQHQQTCQYFTIRGRTAFGTPALANDTNTGSHGGILVLADPSCGLTPLESYANQGGGVQAFLWQATDCAILVAGTYMKTGDTLQSDVQGLKSMSGVAGKGGKYWICLYSLVASSMLKW